jgi:hypothetical protein
MNRSEVITGIQALRHMLESNRKHHMLREEDLIYYDKVLQEARLAVLLNEQNDPHAKL